MKFNNTKELYKMIHEFKINEKIESMTEYLQEEKIEDIIDYINIESTKHVFNTSIYKDEILNEDIVLKHNITNDFYGKKKYTSLFYKRNYNLKSCLPTSMYCSKCKTMHSEIDYKGYKKDNTIIIEQITCLKCNTTFDVENIKLNTPEPEILCGKIWDNGDKITISYKASHSLFNNNTGKHYYTDSLVRVTFNTKTGQTYLTTRGYAYKEQVYIWSRYNKVPPMMYNCTYNDIVPENIFCILAKLEKVEAIKNKTIICPDSFNISKKEKELKNRFLDMLETKIQQNYTYKITTLREYCEKANKSIYNNLLLHAKLHNRFINLCPCTTSCELINKNFNFTMKLIKREDVNPFISLYKGKKVKVGKKTQALLSKNVNNHQTISFFSDVLLHFKNPDIINKLITRYINSGETYFSIPKAYYRYDNNNKYDTVNVWIKHRGEHYVAKQIIQMIDDEKDYRTIFKVEDSSEKKRSKEKAQFICDSIVMLHQISSCIPKIDIDEVFPFKNEKQWHNNINSFFNSDEFRAIKSKEEYDIIFKMEKEIFELEDTKNNIFIAKNAGELSKIGRKMNICVGSYRDYILKGNCRIAYVYINDEYVACLELQKQKIKKKTKYSLVQAKLKYNRIPKHNNIEIHNKIVKWCKDNKIKINTNDMKQHYIVEQDQLENKTMYMQ